MVNNKSAIALFFLWEVILITDSLLILISNIYQFLIKLVPNFTFIETLVSAKNQFIDFISDFIAYTFHNKNLTLYHQQ